MSRWTPLLQEARRGIKSLRLVPLRIGHGSVPVYFTISTVSFGFPSTRAISTWIGGRRFLPDVSTRGSARGSRRYLSVVTAVHGRADPRKSQEGKKIGHDSYFIAKTETLTALGVADGVGMWERHGIDPAQFSCSLMENCDRLALTSPLSILEGAYSAIQTVRPEILGSSTACVAIIQGQTLRTANLGDSGFIVIRQSAVVHASSPQQHFHNCPYQLSILKMTEEQEQFVHDSPQDADLTTIELEPGDVIILYTDGLVDNLSQEEIVDSVSTSMSPEDVNQVSLNALAKSLVDEAGGPRYEIDETSPFAREAARRALNGYRRDKPDDITVVIAVIM